MGAMKHERGAAQGWQHRLLLAAAVLFADQLCKQLALHSLPPGGTVPVLPFFSLTLTGNPGIAFSALGALGAGPLALLAGVITAVFLVWLVRSGRESHLLRTGLAVIVGGAMGNLADRLRYGEVVDFLHLHALGRSFPIFNTADAALTLGAILLIWDFLAARKRTDSGGPPMGEEGLN